MRSCPARIVVSAAILCLVFSTISQKASAAPILFDATYTGTFNGSVLDPGPPTILFTSGTMFDPLAPFGLTNGNLSHYTSFVDPALPQTIYDGALTVFGGGNTLNVTYTGVFQFTSPTTGMFTLNLLLTGAGGLAGYEGVGQAIGTTVHTSQFDGTYVAEVHAVLEPIPEPASLVLLGTGSLLLLRRHRQTSRT